MEQKRRSWLSLRNLVRFGTVFLVLLLGATLCSFYLLHAHISSQDHPAYVIDRSKHAFEGSGLLAIVILSAHSASDRRNAIRQTWARRQRQKDRWRAYFVVGQPAECVREDETCLKSKNIMQKELSEHGDLILLPKLDHYGILPEKLLFAYQSILSRERSENGELFRWIAKADDDMYVRAEALERYLSKFNHNHPMLLGNIKANTPVSRSGKWAEQHEHYDRPFYPPWPLGSAGHVVSRASAEVLSASANKLRRYQGEDVSLGIWLNELLPHNMTYIHAPSLFTNNFQNGQACQPTTTYSMIGHNLSISDLLFCYESNLNASHVAKDDVWLDEPVDFESEKWNRVGNFIGPGSRGGGAAAFGKEAALEQQRRAQNQHR